MDGGQREREKSSGLLNAVTTHLPLVVSFAALMLTAIRLLGVADFNVITAQAILQESGPAQVLVGTLVSTVPFVFVLSPLAFLLAVTVLDVRGHRPLKEWDLVTLACLVVAAFVFVPLQPLATTLLVAACALLTPSVRAQFRRRLSQGASRPPQTTDPRVLRVAAILRRAGTILLIVSLFMIFAAKDMWLPAERIQQRDRTVIGYVLAETPTQLVILQHSDRIVVRLRASTVISRGYCSVNSRQQYTSIWTWSTHARAHYPNCTPKPAKPKS